MRILVGVPANSVSAIDAAIGVQPDVMIIDLVRGAQVGDRELSQISLRFVVDRARRHGIDVAVRVHPRDAPWWGDDLRSASGSGASAVLVPHVDPVAIEDAARVLDEAADEGPVRIALWGSVDLARTHGDLDDVAPSGLLAAVVVDAPGSGPSLDRPVPLDPFVVERRALVVATAHRHGITAYSRQAYVSAADVSELLSQAQAIGFDGMLFDDHRDIGRAIAATSA